MAASQQRSSGWHALSFDIEIREPESLGCKLIQSRCWSSAKHPPPYDPSSPHPRLSMAPRTMFGFSGSAAVASQPKNNAVARSITYANTALAFSILHLRSKTGCSAMNVLGNSVTDSIAAQAQRKYLCWSSLVCSGSFWSIWHVRSMSGRGHFQT